MSKDVLGRDPFTKPGSAAPAQKPTKRTRPPKPAKAKKKAAPQAPPKPEPPLAKVETDDKEIDRVELLESTSSDAQARKSPLYQSTRFVHQASYFLDIFIEQPQRVGVCQHQSSQGFIAFGF